MQNYLVYYLWDYPPTFQKKVWVPELGEKEIVLVNISEGQLATIIRRHNIVIALEDKKLYSSHVENCGDWIK